MNAYEVAGEGKSYVVDAAIDWGKNHKVLTQIYRLYSRLVDATAEDKRTPCPWKPCETRQAMGLGTGM